MENVSTPLCQACVSTKIDISVKRSAAGWKRLLFLWQLAPPNPPLIFVSRIKLPDVANISLCIHLNRLCTYKHRLLDSKQRDGLSLPWIVMAHC